MYIIGVDGGGTKTVGILTTETGKRIAQLEVGPSNYHVVGEAVTKTVLKTLIVGLFEQAGISNSGKPADRGSCAALSLAHTKVCLGMAGLGRATDRKIIGRICDELSIGKNRILTHDAHIALMSGVGKQEGIIVISGTGSIVYGINVHGQEARTGGWGPLLGDEGSGYDIALRGLKAVARAADGRGTPTELTCRILDTLGLNEPNALIRWVHAAERNALAELAKEVFLAAETGDGAAKQIVTAAVDELACAAAVVIKRLGFTGYFQIVLSGGNLVNQPLFFEELHTKLKTIAPTAAGVLPKHEPAVGAVLLAIDKNVRACSLQ